ncbi:hypothetical protein HOY80DRAFT_986631 [Tuber brumale]|nr:hypothetical protein HOY80DRAFT_986631 [Tuber brumale]
MFFFKHPILQVLILALFAALTNCSPVNHISDKVPHHARDAVDNTNISSQNVNILNEAQFKNSGLKLITGEASSAENGRIVCETSDASPLIWNSRRISYRLLGEFGGWYCCNWNENGGDCSHIMTIDDASTAICGEQGCISCDYLGWNIMTIGKECLRDDRAGGVSYLSQGRHIVVY